MIEFVTNKSPDYIFQNYIQTFAPAVSDPDRFFTFSGDTIGGPVNVNGPGQRLTIKLTGIASLGQGPFSVLTERFDPSADTLSVVTLKGHPLAGWRYWRVYSIGPGDVVIETGAYDGPGPGLKNYIGYYLARSQNFISRSWMEFLLYILNQKEDLGPTQSIQGYLTIQGIGTLPATELLKGVWDETGAFKSYILNNVCQAQTCD